MNTIVRSVTGDPSNGAAIAEAAALLQKGGLVAFPTETVYGLGANALCADAVAGIFRAKGRPQDNPLIVHIADFAQLAQLTVRIPPTAIPLAEAFWPGPFTMVFRKSNAVPGVTAGGLDTVAVRLPAHKAALALIKRAKVPVAAPSANVSGRPSPTTAAHVLQDLDGKIHMLLDGGPCTYGLESTVLDMTASPPRLLRPGAVTPEMIRGVCGPVDLDRHILRANDSQGPPKAPGMKYTHYAPRAALTIIEGAPAAVSAYIAAQIAQNPAMRIGVLAGAETAAQYDHGTAAVVSIGSRARPETIAAGLYAGLRRLDEMGVDQIYAESFPADGIGLAIMNRLQKAAGFALIRV